MQTIVSSLELFQLTEKGSDGPSHCHILQFLRDLTCIQMLKILVAEIEGQVGVGASAVGAQSSTKEFDEGADRIKGIFNDGLPLYLGEVEAVQDILKLKSYRLDIMQKAYRGACLVYDVF